MDRGNRLSALIAPTRVDEFLAKYWGSDVLLIQERDLRVYHGLPNLDDFEYLLSSLSAPEAGWCSFVKGHSSPPPATAITRDGTLHMEEVYRAIDEKFTLLLTKLHRRHAGTGDLCRALTGDLRSQGIVLQRPVGANAYFTPPDAQGFAPHYDHHDVFILQLTGSKEWLTYRRVAQWPVEPMQRGLEADNLGPATRIFTLSPGDLIYIPRGFAHEAKTGASASLHLTLSIYPATWADVFTKIVRTNVLLREGLPRGFCEDGVPSGVDLSNLGRLAGCLAESEVANAAMLETFQQVIKDGDLPPRGLFKRLGARLGVESRSWISPRADLEARTEIVNGDALLHLPGTVIRADHRAAPFFRKFCEGEPFRLCDLDSEIGLAPLIGLAEEFVKQGFVTVNQNDLG